MWANVISTQPHSSFKTLMNSSETHLFRTQLCSRVTYLSGLSASCGERPRCCFVLQRIGSGMKKWMKAAFNLGTQTVSGSLKLFFFLFFANTLLEVEDRETTWCRPPASPDASVENDELLALSLPNFPVFEGWKGSLLRLLQSWSWLRFCFSAVHAVYGAWRIHFCPFSPPWPLLWALCAHQGWAFGLASAHPQCSELRPLQLFSQSALSLALPWTVSFLPLLWKHPSVPRNCWRGLRAPSGYYSSLHTRALQAFSSGAPFRIHKHIFSGCAQLLSGLVGFQLTSLTTFEISKP